MQRSSFYAGPLTGLLLALGTVNGAEASVITLVPQASVVTEGNQVVFDLWMDFTGDPTLGGDIDITYGNFTDGNQLTLISYTPYTGNPDFQPAAGGDPAYTSAPWPDVNNYVASYNMFDPPTPSATGLTGIAVGDFNNGLDGQFLIGTLMFQANTAGGPYTLAAQDAGGFYSFNGGNPQQFPAYDNTGASVTVDPAAGGGGTVPLPSTAWLMLAGVLGFAKRRRAWA